jgi:hypothetical protein
VGTAGVGLYLWSAGDARGDRPWPGVALYYGVLAFNLSITAWITEWLLFGVGLAVHAGIALAAWTLPGRLERHRSGGARRVQRRSVVQ